GSACQRQPRDVDRTRRTPDDRAAPRCTGDTPVADWARRARRTWRRRDRTVGRRPEPVGQRDRRSGGAGRQNSPARLPAWQPTAAHRPVTRGPRAAAGVRRAGRRGGGAIGRAGCGVAELPPTADGTLEPAGPDAGGPAGLECREAIASV